MASTEDFAQHLRSQIARDPQAAAPIEQHAFDAEAAMLVYNARTGANLTQTQLAGLVGTRQSVIARLEDWEHSGHSLSMLRKIGDALGQSLHVEFSPRAAEFLAPASTEPNAEIARQHDKRRKKGSGKTSAKGKRRR